MYNRRLYSCQEILDISQIFQCAIIGGETQGFEYEELINENLDQMSEAWRKNTEKTEEKLTLD